MWISRAEYERLVAAEAALGAHRAVHVRELRTLARRMQLAEKRAADAESALSIERHDNRRAERHLTNTLVRAKEIGGYPMVNEPTEAARAVSHTPRSFEDSIDPGELEAVIAAGASAGVSRDEAIAFLKKEKGF